MAILLGRIRERQGPNDGSSFFSLSLFTFSLHFLLFLGRCYSYSSSSIIHHPSLYRSLFAMRYVWKSLTHILTHWLSVCLSVCCSKQVFLWISSSFSANNSLRSLFSPTLSARKYTYTNTHMVGNHLPPLHPFREDTCSDSTDSTDRQTRNIIFSFLLAIAVLLVLTQKPKTCLLAVDFIELALPVLTDRSRVSQEGYLYWRMVNAYKVKSTRDKKIWNK